MAATHVLHSFWRRHRWTALRSLLLVALLHRLHFLAFLAASSPVWLLTAFLLGAVLVHSEPNVPLAVASEDEDRHLYKKIRRHLTTGTGTRTTQCGSSSSSEEEDPGNESEEDVDEDHLVVDKEEAVAWTADDEHSIQSIGSLELERDARLEKLMSRRTVHRNLIDLDVHIPAVLAPRTKNPFDLHHHHRHSSSYYDDHDAAAAAAMDTPSSAPPSLLGHHTNPFDIHIQQQSHRDPDEDTEEENKRAAMLRRHDSFTASAAPLARPSRFKPYFVADVPVPEGAGGRDAAGSDNSNSNSSSPSSSTASDHQSQQEAAARVEEAPTAPTSPSHTWDGKGNGMVVAVDVELISDSSDDDMSLQADDATGVSLNNARDPSDEDEEDSFEVESITQQVAAGKQLLQPPHVTAVVEPMSPPSEQGQGHRQQQQDEEEKVASIVSSSNEWVLPTMLASVDEKEKRERELTEIREHHIVDAVPVIDSSAGAGVGAAGAVVAAAPTPPAAAAAKPPPVAAPPPPRPTAAAAPTPPPPAAAAAAAGPPPVAAPPQPAATSAAPAPQATAAVASTPSGKLSSKSKVASKKIDPKKAVFGFFRK